MSRASEWREAGRAAARSEAVEVKLPSGARILARRPEPTQLAAMGRLPFRLVAATMDHQEPLTGSGEDVVEFLQDARNLLLYVCVEPRISTDPRGPEEIHPRDIPREDWTFLLRWALRAEEGQQLEPFRPDGGDAGDRTDSQGLRPAAVGADGN